MSKLHLKWTFLLNGSDAESSHSLDVIEIPHKKNNNKEWEWEWCKTNTFLYPAILSRVYCILCVSFYCICFDYYFYFITAVEKVKWSHYQVPAERCECEAHLTHTHISHRTQHIATHQAVHYIRWAHRHIGSLRGIHQLHGTPCRADT